MIHRRFAVWSRPIAPSARRPLFAVVAFALVAAALASWTVVRSDERAHGERGSLDEPPASVEQLPAPSSGSPAGSPVSGVPRLSAPAAAHAAARRAASRFLTGGYLAYAYGRARPQRISAATDELRLELASASPRAPLAERRRKARVSSLHVEQATVVGAEAVALVRDGARAYEVYLTLSKTGGRWRVAEASG